MSDAAREGRPRLRDLSPAEALREFLRLESASGLLLIGATVLALVAANTPLRPFYEALLDTPLAIRLGDLEVYKPLLLWVNDGLMAIFFLLIGLEVKREMIDGELADPRRVVLPGIAALGGIAGPAGLYWLFNAGDPVAMAGWAIPAATDIAFALGVLALLGSRVPPSLKMFLLLLAIIDDLAAIVIIAIFYTSNLSTLSLILAGVCLAVLLVLNVAGVTRRSAYVLVGIALWTCVLKSGVHATLAGVALAFAIPMRADPETGHSLLRDFEHRLHPWVAYAILPIFAFANAGLPLAGLSLGDLFAPVPLGIFAGLFVGKQVGVFGLAALAILVGLAKRPEGAGWLQLWGVSVLTGIGFTMSLFISSLAFGQSGDGGGDLMADRLGILAGSLASALLGAAILWLAGRGSPEPATNQEPARA